MQKNERRMDDISDQFHRKRGICCVSCWSDEYRALAKKKERQELRLAGALVPRIGSGSGD